MENIQLFNGDCLEVMKNIHDKSVDMILCDLPFELTDNEWDKIIDFEKIWYQYNRIIKDNGAIVLFGVEPFSSKIRMSNLNFYKYDWYWEKARPTGFLNARKQPLRNIETISVFYRKQCTYNPQGVISCKKMTKRSKTGDNWVTTTKNEYVQTQTNNKIQS